MFPGYIFVKMREPEKFFVRMRQISSFSQILHDEEFTCYTVSRGEQEFLESLMGEDSGYTVRMSVAKVDSDGKLISATNPLGQYLDRVTRQRLRKRYACIETEILGGQKKMVFGFWLETDLEKQD